MPQVCETYFSFRGFELNNLTGRIPDDLGNISTLRILDLSGNRLSGKLPPKLGQLKALQHLQLSENEFTGMLPKEFAELTEITTMFLYGNQLSGPIPNVFGKWKSLERLALFGNNFEGPLPKEISRLENLFVMFISDVAEKSGQGLPFPNISKLRSLQYLMLRNCSITGQIPTYLGEMPLTNIDLSFNRLTGTLPKAITKLALKKIFLTGNNLTGSIPNLGKDWTKINADFSHNNFTNVNFTYFRNMSRNINLYACCSPTSSPQLANEWERQDFSCADEKPNNFELFINCGGEEMKIGDHIFEADLQKQGASTVYLSKKKNWAYSSTGDFISLDEDKVDYVRNSTCGVNLVDAPLYSSARVSPMSLKYFGLCLINGNYSVTLQFAEIIFTDDEDYSSLGKRVFDVFIQGEPVLTDFNIKQEAGGSNKAVVKNFSTVVTNHLLEIHFYWAGKGSLFIPPGIYGPLISAISVTRVQKPSLGAKLSAASIAGIAGSAVLGIVLVLLFLWKMGWLGKKDLRDEDLKVLELFPGGFFNFHQIKAATGNFHSENKIGEGGFGPVFKGILPNKSLIAVKQLSSKSKQGTREFINEVGTISALKHPNLVRLLGCCTENNQLLLVYEYMENNSLSSALFDPGNLKSRLNWRIRYNICLGIAKGLAFLHEESKLKIIHRDIKPTNVLLDKDLNAKISDFGLAKHCEGANTHIITKVAGTSGYMAPEYAMRGHLTNKADVYSFGVVTLELMSGKNSTDYKPNDETVFLLDLAYVLQQKGNLLELIDPDLKMDYSVKEATRVLDLAMLCTNPSPTLRPIMSDVVKILEGKMKMKSLPVQAPYSVDDFERARAVADLSVSTHSGSTSTEGTSNPFSSSLTSKVEELDTHVQIPLHEISNENA
ncbi:Protein kinase domain [Macleaya cordata]|uniref:non-specific serine/threonine protein kinase n=1 Tax=Macleaya cordata TaxID=56857 RepID=A0A200QIY1_MACCD|nr:Protein kinase domain [Macleaya cordata]